MSDAADSRTAGFQAWRHLLFIHWRLDPNELQTHLPAELEVETWDGSAWLGLVPFSMERVRPWWFPPVPGISWFLETNLRTYVRHESGLSAVWFFSLDAGNRLAVWVARTFWHLNYIDCHMEQSCDATTLSYRGRRRKSSETGYDIRCRLPTAVPRPADSGSLEEFLLERYTLLSQDRSGRFFSGRVHHKPYEYSTIEELHCRESLTHPLRTPGACEQPPDHVAYSPGVDVRVSPLRIITNRTTGQPHQQLPDSTENL